MKLDKECVRDVLLSIENLNTTSLTHDNFLNLPELGSYSSETLVYTAKKLHEAGFLNGSFDFYMDNEIHITISSLTWNGHEYLDTIRDPHIWNTTKETANKFGTVSLEILGEIAKNLLKQKLGLM